MSTPTPPIPHTIDQVLDAEAFLNDVIPAYEHGTADRGLPADLNTARSIMPPASSAARDFSFIAPELPRFHADQCVGCMECVNQCPDNAILAKVLPEQTVEAHVAGIDDPTLRESFEKDWAKTRKYHDVPAKRGGTPGRFGLVIDPTKCKGCGLCVDVCGDDALAMIAKDTRVLTESRAKLDRFRHAPETPAEYINEKVLGDMMLSERAHTFVGGSGACAGCGEATAMRMMAGATGFVHGPDSYGIVASTGCNTVCCSAYPYNPYQVPWSNSLFENAPTYAMGIRTRWDQAGLADKKLWVIGGDGAMLDIGFQALSRMVMSGMDINVLVLDTQVYSNTGGQASTATFTGQETKMSVIGKAKPGKTERRKELGQILMAHGDLFVAQTTAAHPNHFYKAIMRANEYKGPSVVICYTACLTEHGIGDDQAHHQARLAVDSRAFPLFIYDPEAGEDDADRIDLRGNPAPKQDWYTDPKTKQQVDFITFARTEGRFARNFDREGQPGPALITANEERRRNWRHLQRLAGLTPAEEALT